MLKKKIILEHACIYPKFILIINERWINKILNCILGLQQSESAEFHCTNKFSLVKIRLQ